MVISEATVGSEEFERCPKCHELFPLPDLVDHAPTCTASVSDLTIAIKTPTVTDHFSVSPPTECSIVTQDCQFCGILLPEDLMSNHYPKCERQHFSQSRSEGSSTIEEIDPAVLPEHLIQMDELSTRLTIEDDWSVHSLASSTKTREESADRKVEDSNDLISLPYSYYDCEEECLYCFKMFAVSVLVEHACNCASRHEVRYFYENVP